MLHPLIPKIRFPACCHARLHKNLWLCLGLLALALGSGSQVYAASAQGIGPLQVRNITPIAHLYGIPAGLGSQIWHSASADTQPFEYALNIEHASLFTTGRAPQTSVFLDGETTVANYSIRRGFTNASQQRWEWGAAIPVVLHSGGVFDNTIEQFHDLFGFRDGGRSIAADDRIDYLVQVDGEIYANFQDSKTRIGDVRSWLGYQWFDTPKRSLAARAQLKLPTGSVASLSGSGGTDLAVWLEYGEHSLLSTYRIGLHLMLGSAYLAEGDLAPRRQNHWVGFGQFGLYYQFSPNVQLHAQLAGQTEIIDSPVKQAQGAAVQGTLGARIRVRERLFLDLGLVEDIRSRSSADVVFNLRLAAQL